jgi:hypothetical protein
MIIVVPSWVVTTAIGGAQVTLSVSDDDLEAVIRTLRRNGVTTIALSKQDPYPAVGKQVAS